MTLEELELKLNNQQSQIDELSKSVGSYVSQIDKFVTLGDFNQLKDAATKDTQTLRDSISTVVADINVMKGELTSLGAKVMEKTPAPPPKKGFSLPSLFD